MYRHIIMFYIHCSDIALSLIHDNNVITIKFIFKNIQLTSNIELD